MEKRSGTDGRVADHLQKTCDPRPLPGSDPDYPERDRRRRLEQEPIGPDQTQVPPEHKILRNAKAVHRNSMPENRLTSRSEEVPPVQVWREGLPVRKDYLQVPRQPKMEQILRFLHRNLPERIPLQFAQS